MKVSNMNPCFICQHDGALNQILRALSAHQTKLLSKWQTAHSVFNNDPTHVANRDCLTRWEVISPDGSKTIISPYIVYEALWEKSFFVNPLKYDWLHFDIHSIERDAYLISVIDVFQLMMETWSFHQATNKSELATYFRLFVELLKTLMLHSMRFGYLER